MTDRRHIESCQRAPLRPPRRRDYGPNDLQLDGAREVLRSAPAVAQRSGVEHVFLGLENRA